MSLRRVTFLVHDDEMGGDGVEEPWHRIINVYTEDGRHLIGLADGHFPDQDEVAALAQFIGEELA